MKKLILIPTILASATPLVCMVSCNPDAPVPPGPSPEEDWKATKQEMEDAIRLVNENYLQVNSHFIRLNEIGFYVEENYIALQSPTVYSRQHSKIKDGISHQDEQDYVKKEEDGTYTEYSRNLSFNPVWNKEEHCSESKFITIAETGTVYWNTYLQFSEDPQAVAIIDETNKCYTYLTERDTEEVTCSFFFKNKKLIKLILDGHYSGQTTGYSKMTFDYQPIEPERPDSYNFDSHIEYSHDGIPVIASENNDRIIIDTSAEYWFKTDCSNCTDATLWNSEYSYLSFFDESGVMITDLSFEVLFYTIDNNIYSQVLPSDLIAGTFYCTEDTICALADSAIANDAKIDILVKFNNHDGKKINFAWSNQRL